VLNVSPGPMECAAVRRARPSRNGPSRSASSRAVRMLLSMSCKEDTMPKNSRPKGGRPSRNFDPRYAGKKQNRFAPKPDARGAGGRGRDADEASGSRTEWAPRGTSHPSPKHRGYRAPEPAADRGPKRRWTEQERAGRNESRGIRDHAGRRDERASRDDRGQGRGGFGSRDERSFGARRDERGSGPRRVDRGFQGRRDDRGFQGRRDDRRRGDRFGSSERRDSRTFGDRDGARFRDEHRGGFGSRDAGRR